MKSSVVALLLYFSDKKFQSIGDNTIIRGAREKWNKWKDIDTMEWNTSLDVCYMPNPFFKTFLSKYCLVQSIAILFERAAFSLNRFSNLLKYLRFDYKTARSAQYERDVFCHKSQLAKWVDTFHSKLATHFVHGENITDEGKPLSFRIRCKSMQYMPSEPDKQAFNCSRYSGLVKQLMTIPWELSHNSENKLLVFGLETRMLA